MAGEEPLYGSAVHWIGTFIAVSVVLAIVIGMIAVVRMTADDSEKHRELKKYFEALFGGAVSPYDPEKPSDRTAAEPASAEPFEEDCPACGAAATHRDEHCPSCGLRLF
ncbi:zinc ribbon domain-containing protein [Paenibacillus sp. MSJ-34]|uniref:zinc ribbon domain-containing protein n=1 Tax=Paenibacillus sp. MSJ-34 TaxID=2841529 RepID=UPI001C0FEECD|nr:zinc ribbon domain-containing protein [Paenibacillus sp. MSJ-34]MBU5441039.1 zinc ribbon domain-containing protein [Paenibacillus sp. MSJ-34]